MSNLHGMILDIPDLVDKSAVVGDPWMRGYKHGHRAARIAAADIVLNNAFDIEESNRNAYAEGRKDELEASRVDELVDALNGMLSVWCTVCNCQGWEPEHMQQYTDARAVLTKLEQTK